MANFLLEPRVCLPKNLRWQRHNRTFNDFTLVVWLENVQIAEIPQEHSNKWCSSRWPLFTDDKKTENIDGKKLSHIPDPTPWLTSPVDPSSPVGRKVSGANIGIVFHTKYEGPNLFKRCPPSFGVNDSDYNVSSSVWNVSNIIPERGWCWPPSVSQEYVTLPELPLDRRRVRSVRSRSVFNDIQSGKKALQIDTIFLQFFNSYYRKGSFVPGVSQTYNEFVRYLVINNAQSVRTKHLMSKPDKRFKFVECHWLHSRSPTSVHHVDRLTWTWHVPRWCWWVRWTRLLPLQAFVDTGNGYKVTNQEGFVVMSPQTEQSNSLTDLSSRC